MLFESSLELLEITLQFETDLNLRYRQLSCKHIFLFLSLGPYNICIFSTLTF